MRPLTPTARLARPLHARAALGAALLCAALAGCDDDDDDDNGGGGGPGQVASLFYAARASGFVEELDGQLAQQRTLETGADEGMTLDLMRTLIHAGSGASAAGGSVRFFCSAPQRPDMASFDAAFDRQLGGGGGTMSGLVEPRGVAIAHELGLLMVADSGADDVKVFGSAAGGDAPPLAVSPLPAAPFGIAFDAAADRLFVAMDDGRVAAFDDYVAGGFGTAGPTRFLRPVDAGGVPVATTLRGIAHDAAADRLVVSDPGLLAGAGFDTDGKLIVLSNPSAASGDVLPLRTVTGPQTLLGNPGYISLDGSRLVVGEQAGNLLLVFQNILTGAGTNQAPSSQVQFADPRGIARLRVDEDLETEVGPQVSDLDEAGIAIGAVVVTSNPGMPSSPDFGLITRLEPDLSGVQTQFATAEALESVTFDLSGDAYVSFDDGSDADGGILVINRLAKGREAGMLSESRDREIRGAATGLDAPKGVELTGTGLVLVIDNDAAEPAILAFGACAGGDVAPVFAVTDTGGARPWSLDYDRGADRLFVATTSGTVLVYDDFLDGPAPHAPDRTIALVDEQGMPAADNLLPGINLHGIVHVADGDWLILSDVRDIGDDTDGQILIVSDASVADGYVEPAARLAGPMSLLGNPVAIAYDGANLYVAEKSNDLVLRFDAILGLVGEFDGPPDAQIHVVAPESLALAPEYLSSDPED